MVLNRIVTAEYPRPAMLAPLPAERNVDIESPVQNPECPLVHGHSGGNCPRGEITQHAYLFHDRFTWSLYRFRHSTLRLLGAPIACRILVGKSAHRSSTRTP